jgi:hypothetical protein
VRRRGMFLIPELAIERWLFHDGLSVNDGRLVALAPAVEEATGIRDRLLEELAASGLDADRALDRALNEAAEAFRSQPPDFNESTTKVRIALETAAPCWEARAPVPPAMRCGSLGRPMRKPFYGLGWTPARGGLCRRARATCARRGTPSMLVPSSCRLGKSSIFLRRIVGVMFMRVNSKCAHQVRPPRGRIEGSAAVG